MYERIVVALQSFGQPAALFECRGEVDQRDCQRRIQGGGAPERCFRPIQIAECGPRQAKIVVSDGVIRIESQRALEAGPRCLDFAHLHQRLPQIVVGPSAARLESGRGPKHLDGFAGTSQGKQGAPKAPVRCRVARPQLRQAQQQRNGVDRTA